jgi:predicted DNA-binding antitoxin AbrB/MazE fold protein
MTLKTIAVYSEGALLPASPLPLAEGQTVEVTISPATIAVPSKDEIEKRIRAAKTLEEAFAITEQFPEEDDGYDLYQAMNANRHPSERVLFPPELKGISW